MHTQAKSTGAAGKNEKVAAAAAASGKAANTPADATVGKKDSVGKKEAGGAASAGVDKKKTK